jgi:hypothetical protein
MKSWHALSASESSFKKFNVVRIMYHSANKLEVDLWLVLPKLRKSCRSQERLATSESDSASHDGNNGQCIG